MVLAPEERRFLEAVARVSRANPFTVDLLEAERDALGAEFVAESPVWSLDVQDPLKPRANAWRLAAKLDALLPNVRNRFHNGRPGTDVDRELYLDASLWSLYHSFYHQISDSAFSVEPPRTRWGFYRDFQRSWGERMQVLDRLPDSMTPAHTFGLFAQLVRAFRLLFENILGGSQPAARLRASVWRSIFTHDLKRYGRTLYRRMSTFSTLITGPSGTGKEVVARTIAASGYQPFDEHKLTFPFEAAELFWPLNIAALSPTLVESELFGHRRGAFTGALGDRKGYLESCPELGSVFLDELGEMSPEVQVKLLRVIETREFTPVGDTKARRFDGKLIAATNRDLPAAIREGRFREDLYYRLCSDLVETPSLARQIEETPAVMEDLVQYMARKNGGDEAFADSAQRWIREHLKGHTWPGNYRELEQCVRNLLIRGEYRPSRSIDESSEWMAQLQRGELTADQMLNHYTKLVHRKEGTYEGAARKLGLDRRTVKARVCAIQSC